MRIINLQLSTTFVTVIAIFVWLQGCTSQDGSQSMTDSPVETDSLLTQQKSAEPFVNFSEDAVLGSNVYVPVYSHIYQLNQQKTFNLTATLSIRNTDMQKAITLKKVHYYDSKGELVHRYLDQPKAISALSSISFVVEEEDLRGGVGANFLVLWEAADTVSQPIIEAVMISTSQQQGISFVSEGRVIESLNRSSN